VWTERKENEIKRLKKKKLKECMMRKTKGMNPIQKYIFRSKTLKELYDRENANDECHSPLNSRGETYQGKIDNGEYNNIFQWQKRRTKGRESAIEQVYKKNQLDEVF
jgi:hypothetical protein